MRNYPFNTFKYGIFNKLPEQSIPDGAARDSLNWLTLNNKLELIRGYSILGTEQSGSGRVSGLRVGKKANGIEVPFATYARKIRYYDSIAGDWAEIGTDTLPAAASGEDISLDLFESRAGKQMWLNSPNAGPFKINIANPGTIVPMYDAAVNYKGWMRFFDNQAYLWNIDNVDKSAVRLSFIETRGLADYSLVTNEQFAYGDGVTTTFTRYLNFKSKATGTLTSTGTNVSDNDTVTIGSQTYRFKNTMALANDVKIGVDAATSLANLALAINAWGTAGTNYFAGTLANASAESSTVTATTLLVLSRVPGTAGNSIATTEVAATLSFAAATLTLGAADKRHAFAIALNGNEVFTDDLSGNLTGSAGGTGTINYATGLISVTFVVAPPALASQVITYSYVDETQTWDGGAAGGVANFVVPSSRVSGQPNVFREDHGGDIKTIVSLKDHKFVVHETAIYDLLPSLDDTATTNTLFRDNIGSKFLRGALATPEGVYAVDTSDPNYLRFVLVSYNTASTDIKPVNISVNLDLSAYNFDKTVIFAFEDYIIFSCRTLNETFNNRAFLFHRVYKTFDLCDYSISSADIYDGSLIAGDASTNNVQTLFSGYDANGDIITNFWTSGISKLGFLNARGKRYPIRNLKKVKKILMEGDIGPEQVIHLFWSPDRGNPVEILDEEGQPIISGTGSYVDKTRRVDIGSRTVGRSTIGGGGDGIEAYHYEREIKFHQDKFADGQITIMASEIGYASVTNLEFRDVRIKQDKPARKYRVN